MTYLVIDLETSAKAVYEKVANNFYNKILCIGLKYKDKEPIALPQDYPPKGWLDGVKTLIGHNLAFDLKFLWRNEELQDFFRRGGRIWCTAAAEFIISKQEHKFPKLREIAVNKYGCKFREKHIEKLFESGLDTSEGDIKLLLEDVTNDILDTESIALQQVKIAKEQGTFNLIVARMDSLLATVEMEFNGIKVDMEIFNRNKKQLEDELEHYKKELDILVKKYWR